MSSISRAKNMVTEDKLPRPESRCITRCQVCDWYGYPHEKVIIEFEGIRAEDEDGFAYKFTEYDYHTEPGEKRTKHIHKYDPKVVQEDVDSALKIRNVGSCQE